MGNPARELRRSFHQHRRRGVNETAATRLAVTELLAELGLAVLPEEELRSALERLAWLLIAAKHSAALDACTSFIGPVRPRGAPGGTLPWEVGAGDDGAW